MTQVTLQEETKGGAARAVRASEVTMNPATRGAGERPVMTVRLVVK